MNNYVYWVHLPNQKIKLDGYIGVTNNVKRRWKEHILKKHCVHFGNAITKYQDDLVWEIIFIGPKEGCYQLEEYFRPTPGIGWNIAQGGNCSNNVNRKLSDETKDKLSKSRKGKPSWCKGKTGIFSKEALHKIGTASKNRTQGKDNPMYGKTHSLEAKQKMSIARKGKPGKTGAANSNAKRVLCITTNTYYSTVTEAANILQVSVQALSMHLRQKTKTCCGKVFCFA